MFSFSFHRPRQARKRRRSSSAALGELLEAKLPLTGNLDGFIFHDTNANGFFDIGESGLSDVRAHFDTNNNGIVDQTVTTATATGLPVSIPENGTRQVSVTVPETGRYVVDVDVDLTIDNFFGDPLTVRLVAPDGTSVTLASRLDKGLDDVTFDDSAMPELSTRFGDLVGTQFPVGNLSDFQGIEATGRWTLSASLSGGFVDRDLEAWSLRITTTDELVFETGSDGQFRLNDLPVGETALSIVPPNGFRTANDETRFDVAVNDGQLTAISIPLLEKPNIVSGSVFHDTDGNRIIDESETGLAAWTVFVDANGNNVLDDGEIRTETITADDPDTPFVSEVGTYSLTLPEQGEFDIRAIPPGGEDWVSYPLTEGAEFELYGKVFFGDFVRVRSTQSVVAVGNIRENVSELDYSLTGERFYAINSNTLLGEFDLETGLFRNIGTFVTDEDEVVSMRGISVLPNGELRGASANGLYRIDKTTGRVELIHETVDELLFIDYGFDGKLYGLVAEFGLWELDPLTGERLRQLSTVEFDGGIDVSPDGQIFFTRNGGLLASISTADGSVLQDRVISQTLADGIASIPEAAWDSITVSPAEPATNINFAGYQTSAIRGRVELMGEDGLLGLEGETVYVDLDRNGQFSLNEPSVQTFGDDSDTPEDEAGNFALLDLPAGTYEVRQVVNPTMDQVSPSGSNRVEALAGEVASGLLFTNQLGTSFSGHAFLDANGNGTQDEGESSLEDITVYIDANDNGLFEDREFSSVTGMDDLDTEASELGRFEFGPLSSLDYTVRAVIPDGWIQTMPQDNLSVTLPIDPLTSLSFGLVRGGTVSGFVFSDVNGNGEKGFFEQPVEGATVFIDLNENGEHDELEPTSTNGENGFLFDTLAAGEYTIAVLPTEGFETPAARQVSVTLDTDIASFDFASEQQLGTITGTKWWDENEDGVRDADELGLSGFTIYVDLNENGQLDLGEPSVVTATDDFATPEDESGMYRFTDLPSGTYQIREIQQPNWQQTFPALTSPTTSGRLFTLNADINRIEERDLETGAVIDSLPWQGDLDFFSDSQGVALGPHSLFYVSEIDRTPHLTEIDHNTGEVLGQHELPNRTYRGAAYLEGVVYLIDSSDDFYVWDPTTEMLSSSIRGPFTSASGGLAASADGSFYVRSSSTVEVLDSNFNEFDTIVLPFEFDGIEQADGILYSFSRTSIGRFEASTGRFLDSVAITPDSVDAIAVGAEFTQADFHVVEVSNGETEAGFDFGTRLQPRLDVSGFAWLDENANGVQDESEANIEGVRIEIERLGTDESPVVVNTLGDLIQTPQADETGRYTASLLPGTYRISAAHPDLTLTSPFNGSPQTAGLIYELVEEDGELQINYTTFDGNVVQDIELPEQPQFIGPQGLTVTNASLVYVDGSNGRSPRIWEFDRTTGEVLKSGLLAEPISLAAGLASFEGSIFVGGDSNSIERYSLESLVHQESIGVELTSISGMVADASSRSLIISGFRLGQPTLARVGVDDGATTYHSLDAPIAGGLVIVSGELYAEGADPQTLRRFDLDSLTLQGTRPWSTQPHGLASLTTEPNSHYIFVPESVTNDSSAGPFDFGFTAIDAPREDVNGDGEVSRADAELIRDAILANEPYNELFDLNDDNVVDRFDVDWIATQLTVVGSGDVNLDGESGFADFLVLSVHFGQEALGGWLDGDIDGDGFVTFADFLILSRGPF